MQRYNYSKWLNAAVIIIPLILLFSCSPTRYVPEGSYLLDGFEVKTDAREIRKRHLNEYVRQSSNSYVFGLFRMQLGIYNLAGPDTTRWYNRIPRRIGQAPVILDTLLTEISANQLRSYHINRGYYDARVNTNIETRGQRARVTYEIESGVPYRIQDYQVDVPYDGLRSVADDTLRTLIRQGSLFDVYLLNEERDRVAQRMRRLGYFNFNKDMLAYRADSADHQVNVALELREFLMARRDTLPFTIFRRFHVRNIVYTLIPSVSATSGGQSNPVDTLSFGAFHLISQPESFITLNALRSGTFIMPGSMYSDADVERTYASLNGMPPVKYTHITFVQAPGDSLDCHITVAEAKSLSLSSKAELTFTEGYWGGALNLGLVNRNLFRQAESLSFSGRLALERQDDVIAQEWGAQAAIRVPRVIIPFAPDPYSNRFFGNTEFRSTFNYQYRPQEFSATNVGGGIKYTWNRGRRIHNFDMLDLSYVYFPWISQQFRDNFLNTGLYNRYNYEDYLIMRINYSSSYTSFNVNRPLRNFYTYRYGLESAGNVLYGLNNLLDSPTGNDGFYRLFNIRYSQFVRAEINSSYHQILDQNNRLVYHVGVGVGVPYGNAEIIPFERRFYSGGANSVRGWSESTLGPGTYQRISSRRRDYNQMGDIKLDLNFEFRTKMFWVIEGALFADAGNIWTIRDYDNQPGGAFSIDTFWKQIALAYGVGFRFDFNFVLFRLDLGMKLYDPGVRQGSWNLLPNTREMALHLAIGYPF